ncbi:MAG: DUF4386 domain-containing protein [Kineosporiaceae bacterium]
MSSPQRTARQTGVAYLGLAVTGLLSFVVVRSQLFDVDDPAATAGRLVEHEGLARVGVSLELLVVLTQAVTALLLLQLFRHVDPVMAGGIALFGTANAVALLGSAAAMTAALQVATHPFGDAAGAVGSLYLISDGVWSAGAVFFGLWLIPMGRCALRAGMPRALGYVLVAGGIGYLLSPLLRALLPDLGAAADVVTLPASVGEFWMIGYLLVRGLPSADAVTPPARSAPLADLGSVPAV